MWESRGVREISKSRWASICEVHGDGISTAAAFRSPEPPPMPRRREFPRLPIDPAQFHVHEPHGPIAPLGLREADEFAHHRFAHKHQVAAPLDLPIRTYP